MTSFTRPSPTLVLQATNSEPKSLDMRLSTRYVKYITHGTIRIHGEIYSLKGLNHIHGEEHGHTEREGSSHREDHWRRDTTGHAVTLNDLLAITAMVRSQSKDQNYLNDLIIQTA